MTLREPCNTLPKVKCRLNSLVCIASYINVSDRYSMVPTIMLYFSFSLFSLGLLYYEHREELILNSCRSIISIGIIFYLSLLPILSSETCIHRYINVTFSYTNHFRSKCSEHKHASIISIASFQSFN